MVQITALFIYPVKSCRGISLEEAQLGSRGFLHDREFLIVDETNSFLTQRSAPQLATVQIALTKTGLVLKAPDAGELHVSFSGMEEQSRSSSPRHVTIFSDQVLADDVGDEAAEWCSAVLARRCRLVRIGASYARKVRLEENAQEHHHSTQAPEISFTDAFPTLLISEESLADLNTRLPKSLLMDRFRPNIVVRGCAPYDENTWKRVQAGGIVFSCATPCERCVITTIDQETGTRDGVEPLRTLATYRRVPGGSGVIFGQYLIHSGSGKLRVGDALTTERAQGQTPR